MAHWATAAACPGASVSALISEEPLSTLQTQGSSSESEIAQSCPILSDSMDYSLPGSSVHGIFQARVLEWGAIGTEVFESII